MHIVVGTVANINLNRQYTVLYTIYTTCTTQLMWKRLTVGLADVEKIVQYIVYTTTLLLDTVPALV